MAEAPDKPFMTPAEALKKYDYKGADEDQKAINKVETAIAAHFPASFTAGLLSKSANAPIKEEEVHGKMDEAKQKAGEAAANDKDAQKELKEDPGAKNPPAGAAVKPSVKESHPQKPPAVEPKKGKGEDAGHHAGGAPGGKGAASGGRDVGSAPAQTVLEAASTSDKDIDSFLDGYEKKSPEPKEKLSKIKEMAAVSKGFDGQLEKYVTGSGAVDSASAKVVNFLGKKEFSAAFGQNPYDKVQGGLGTIMSGLSRFGNIVSIVGNVCTKIGMVLTVVGLLGMILPPIGAVVSAVARVLNVVGIICDVIGVVIGGILTGLNGVVLAKQIGKGASNEEKAATADMMVSEATSAGGHVLSLAMSYGPGFMKGFKGASKGFVANLFKKFKSIVGKFASKALGPVANWAKNIGYKLGIGLEKGVAKEGTIISRTLEKVRDMKYIKKFNNSGFAKGAERLAGRIDNVGWVNKVDGFGEGLGKSAAGKIDAIDTKVKIPIVGQVHVKTSSWADRLEKSAEDDAKVIANSVEHNAAQNAANRERETIDQAISKNREMGNNEYVDHRGDDGIVPERNIRRSDAAYARADELEAGRADAIANAERTEGAAAKEAHEQKIEKKERAEKNEEARVEEFKKNPKEFQEHTANAERKLEDTERKLEDPNVSPEEKEKLEHQKERLEKSIADRKLTPLIASGGESPETLWGAYKQGKEIFDNAKGIIKNRNDWGWKDEKSEKAEKYTKYVEGKSGHEAHENDEKAERREKIGEFEAENFEHPEVGEHVEVMLEGLDEELGFEGSGGEGDHEGGGDDTAGADLPGGTSDEGGTTAPDEQKTAEPAEPANEPAAAAPASEPAHEEKKEEKAPDPGVLAYWPSLTKQFADGVVELHRMRVVAYEFKKQQFEARKKAHEAAVTFNKAGDSAELQADLAKQHAVKIGPSLDEAKTSGAQAAASGGQADKGSAEQNKGSGASSTPTGTADPGEKPSRWHPIKRIWWYVKQWASEKAAKVFGWIQNQIASLVLEGLCGVSMGDMKAYTEALRRRMEFSKVSGSQGVAAAQKAVADSGKTGGESKSYEQQALADAAECDQNMADADAFSTAVEGTEQDLVQEQKKAKDFLDSLKAAVAAERAEKAAEKAKAAQEAKNAKANTGAGPAPSATSTPGAAPVPKAKSASEKKPKQPKPVSPAAIGKVKNAAGYVSGRATAMLQMLTDVRSRQNTKLQADIAKKGFFIASMYKNMSVGDAILAGFRTQTSAVSSHMGVIQSASAATPEVLHGNAGDVKSKARELDEISHHTHEKLNEAFKSTYEQINGKAA